jgi:HTH-type transcriptional regulator, competence development regulator
MSFGYALRKFREGRGLSLRELGTLCGIDHAYIHRLEKDEKTAPSEDVIEVLARNLKLNARRTRMLGFLVGKNADGALIDLFLEEEDQPVEVFESLATMSFRGRRPDSKDEWRKLAERVKEFVV